MVCRYGVNISYLMMLIYFSIFLLYPSIFHISSNTFPVFDMHYRSDVIFKSTLCVFSFLISCSISYNLSYKYYLRKVYKNIENNVQLSKNYYTGYGLLLISLVLFFTSLQIFDLKDFVQTRKDVYNVLDRSGTIELGLYYVFPKIVSFISMTFCIINFINKKHDSNLLLLIILNLPIFFILNYPPALPRFYLFGYIVFWVVLFVDLRKIRTKLIVLMSFVFGACLLMPIVDALTRRGKGLSDLSLMQSITNYVSGGDFDGLQSINNAVIYVSSYGLSFGRQILSAMLFFIPRSIWSGKAESTGVMTARVAGYDYLNVSSPLPAEMLVDFGYVGMVIGAALLGILLAKIDSVLNRAWMVSPQVMCIGAAVAAYSIIFYRGALLAVGPVLACVAFGTWIIYKLGFRTKMLSSDIRTLHPRHRYRRLPVR